MITKVEAACDFCDATTGTKAVIASLSDAKKAAAGKCGTVITK